jgi:hypothetical protein
MKKLFYPKWWLDITGYWKNKPNIGPGVILFDPSPSLPSDSESLARYYKDGTISALFFTAILSSALTLLAGLFFIRIRERNKQPPRYEYVRINL